MALGTATDPYQPIEGHYKLTRGALEALLAGRTPVGLVTKGPMVVRDADLLAEMSRQLGCTVYMSVPTVDERRVVRARARHRASPSAAACGRSFAMRASTPGS